MSGRSMDWNDPTVKTALWGFPRGMGRDGGIGKNPVKWTSQYGSVVACFYDAGTADGMNEAGLVGNMLYFAESDCGDLAATGKSTISITRTRRFYVAPIDVGGGVPGSQPDLYYNGYPQICCDAGYCHLPVIRRKSGSGHVDPGLPAKGLALMMKDGKIHKHITNLTRKGNNEDEIQSNGNSANAGADHYGFGAGDNHVRC